MPTSVAGNKGLERARRDAGVTLLELLIVLALMSMLVGLLAPRIGRATDNWRLRRAGERVAQILRYARTRALYEGRYYVVEIQPQENRVRLLGASSGFVREYQLPRDVRFGEEASPASFSVMRLIFSPSGAVDERTLWLRNRHGSEVKIHLNLLLGRPGVEVVGTGA